MYAIESPRMSCTDELINLKSDQNEGDTIRRMPSISLFPTSSPRLRFSPALAPALACIAITLPLGSCDNQGIREHTTAKGIERVPERAASITAPSTDPSTEAPGTRADTSTSLRPWTVPDGWIEDTQPRQMRLATYFAPDPQGDIEIAVTRFDGRVGGELATLNRWRSQMGLVPIGESELEQSIVRFSKPGYQGYQTRIDSTAGVMLAAGVYETAIDQTWFVRATLADSDTADRIEPDLFAMASSITENQTRNGQ